MDRNKKICFVIMGFGKKQNPYSNRKIDLDDNYQKIIIPAVSSCGYNCIRADQICESGEIDRSMYALLNEAELVIADITTLNANAMYELGVRHAMRPYSTIIIGADLSSIPFDISHFRVETYNLSGGKLSKKDATKARNDLINLIKSVDLKMDTDSPLYSIFPKYNSSGVNQDMKEIIDKLQYESKSNYGLSEKAKILMSSNNFAEAAVIWHELSERSNDIFFVQQEALCVYKSEQPDKITALKRARDIIEKLRDHIDSETLGITGAIYKRLWIEEKDVSCLKKALDLYKKGWNLLEDHYTGENYSLCLDFMSDIESDTARKDSFRLQAFDVREKIISLLKKRLQEKEPQEDIKWIYASLANCCYATNKEDEGREYEKKFNEQNPSDWEKQSYLHAKQYIFDNILK